MDIVAQYSATGLHQRTVGCCLGCCFISGPVQSVCQLESSHKRRCYWWSLGLQRGSPALRRTKGLRLRNSDEHTWTTHMWPFARTNSARSILRFPYVRRHSIRRFPFRALLFRWLFDKAKGLARVTKKLPPLFFEMLVSEWHPAESIAELVKRVFVGIWLCRMDVHIKN